MTYLIILQYQIKITLKENNWILDRAVNQILI